jgi:hypothetical protein
MFNLPYALGKKQYANLLKINVFVFIESLLLIADC